MSAAVGCSAIMTLVLKNLVARPRPFMETAGEYFQWRQFLDLPADSGFAFPSGHTTVAMAAAALFLTLNKKRSWTAIIFVLLTGFARCYLMAHYPSDILGGIVIGTAGAVIAFSLAPLFFRIGNRIMPARFKRLDV